MDELSDQNGKDRLEVLIARYNYLEFKVHRLNHTVKIRSW